LAFEAEAEIAAPDRTDLIVHRSPTRGHQECGWKPAGRLLDPDRRQGAYHSNNSKKNKNACWQEPTLSWKGVSNVGRVRWLPRA